MNIPQFESTLKDVTGDLCGHEVRKGVLGMSNLYLPVEEILQRYRDGYHPSEEQKMKLFQGTQSEIGIRGRLEIVCKKLGLEWGDPRTLVAYNGRLTGHTDGDVERQIVIEVKTVPDYEILKRMKQDGRVPFKVFSQVNAYCLWGPFERGLVIYETRNEGALWLVDVLPSRKIQDELKQKVERVLQAIESTGSSPGVGS